MVSTTFFLQALWIMISHVYIFTGFSIDAKMQVHIEQCTVQNWHGTALVESKGQSEL